MKFKFLHPLTASVALLCLLTMTAVTGCKDDDNKGPYYPDDFAFKQVLRVEQWSDGQTNAFADFMAVNTAGVEISVQLPSAASIYCQGRKLEYEAPNANDPYSYAYSAILAGTPTEVTFTFNRLANLKFVNTISLKNVPMIRLQPGSTVENDKNYTYTSSIESTTSASIRIFLMRLDGENAGKQYDATLFGDQYYFSGVPSGTYTLRSMSTVTINNLQEQNGGAGGSISACKVYEIKGVKVE